MQIKTDSKLSGWLLIPIGLAFFALPSVAVTVKSGATTVFLIILLPSLIFGWKSWGFLFQEEKILLTSFLVFVFLVGLSLINSSDVSEGVGSYEKILRFAVFIPMYLFIRSNNFEFGPWLSWGLVLGCAVTGLVAIYQFHWLDLPRPGGARHFTRYGLSAVTILLLLTLVMMFEWRKTKLLILGIILAAIILYAIKLNQTRAAMLAILPFIGLLLFYYRHNFNKKLALIFFLVIVIVGVIFLHPSSPVAQSFMQGFMELKALMQNPTENYDSSWGLRPHMLYTGLLIFMQSPTFGTGLGDYAHDALILMESGKTSIQDPWLLTSPHNIYVSLSACQLVSLSACQLVSLSAC